MPELACTHLQNVGMDMHGCTMHIHACLELHGLHLNLTVYVLWIFLSSGVTYIAVLNQPINTAQYPESTLASKRYRCLEMNLYSTFQLLRILCVSGPASQALQDPSIMGILSLWVVMYRDSHNFMTYTRGKLTPMIWQAAVHHRCITAFWLVDLWTPESQGPRA